ncbi:MAG TPA: alpha/beta family hydrolase [Gammaproteobacteria bacterium]|nr:alpha/beta family hydrolase [Gammaproteobacteria bacterium]
MTPTLILQGERDPFGRPDEVDRYELAGGIEIVWVPDGDHSFKPRKRSGRDEAQTPIATAAAIAAGRRRRAHRSDEQFPGRL